MVFGRRFFYSDGNSIRQQVHSLKRQLSDLNSRIEELEDKKGKISQTLRAIDVTQALCKKAQRRSRYLVKKHDFLTLEYNDHDYWIDSSSPVHMDEDGNWDEDSDNYIDAGMRHVHVQPDNSHWLDIEQVCERIVNDHKKATP